MSRDPSNQRTTEKVHFEISKSTLSSLGRWLLVSPLILVILLASGQLALMVPTGMAADDISSKLTANYLPWERVVIPALKPQLLNELLAEEGLPTSVVESGAYWPDLPQATPVAILLTSTPSATHEPQEPTSTSLPGLTFSPTVSPTKAPASHTPTWTAVPTRTTYYVPPPTYTRNSDPNPQAPHRYPDAHTFSHQHAHPDGNSVGHTIGNRYCDSHSNAKLIANCHPDTYSYSNLYTDLDQHGHADTHPDRDIYSDLNQYEHAYAYRDRNADAYTD